MYADYSSDENTSENEKPQGRIFDQDFFPDDEWAMCDTEMESAIRAEERVVSPGSEKRYWIADVLDHQPENLFDAFIHQLAFLLGVKILASHFRKNSVRSFGLAAWHRNRSGEKLEDIAPYPRAATSRHAINAESLMKLYAPELECINAASILSYFGGGPPAEVEKCVKQLQVDTDDAFRLLLSVSTFRAGEFDPMVEAFNPRSPHRAKILKGHDCSKRALNRISKFFDHIGIPEKRTQEIHDEK